MYRLQCALDDWKLQLYRFVLFLLVIIFLFPVGLPQVKPTEFIPWDNYDGLTFYRLKNAEAITVTRQSSTPGHIFLGDFGIGGQDGCDGSTTTTISATITAGATSATFASTTSFKVGDGIYIYNGTTRAWDSTTNLGSIITDISGTTVTWANATINTISSGTKTVYHNETAAIQNQITTSERGGSFKFPDGTCYITSLMLKEQRSYIGTLWNTGAGQPGTSLTQLPGVNADPLIYNENWFSSTTANVTGDRFVVQDMTINGNWTNNTTSDCVKFTGGRVEFNRVRIAGCDDDAIIIPDQHRIGSDLPVTNWTTATSYTAGDRVFHDPDTGCSGSNCRMYLYVSGTTSGATPPTHTSGNASDGGVTWAFQSTSYGSGTGNQVENHFMSVTCSSIGGMCIHATEATGDNDTTDGIIFDLTVEISQGTYAVSLAASAGWNMSNFHFYSQTKSVIFFGQPLATSISHGFIETYGTTCPAPPCTYYGLIVSQAVRDSITVEDVKVRNVLAVSGNDPGTIYVDFAATALSGDSQPATVTFIGNSSSMHNNSTDATQPQIGYKFFRGTPGSSDGDLRVVLIGNKTNSKGSFDSDIVIDSSVVVDASRNNFQSGTTLPTVGTWAEGMEFWIQDDPAGSDTFTATSSPGYIVTKPGTLNTISFTATGSGNTLTHTGGTTALQSLYVGLQITNGSGTRRIISISGTTITLDSTGATATWTHDPPTFTAMPALGTSASRILCSFTTTGGNVGGGEDDLFSTNCSVPASTLSAVGDSIRFSFSGLITAHAVHTDQLKVYLGSTVIFDSTAQTPSQDTDYTITGLCKKTGTNTEKCTVSLATTGAALFTFSKNTAPTETLTGALTLKITGTVAGASPANNDITGLMYDARYEPAP